MTKKKNGPNHNTDKLTMTLKGCIVKEELTIQNIQSKTTLIIEDKYGTPLADDLSRLHGLQRPLQSYYRT